MAYNPDSDFGHGLQESFKLIEIDFRLVQQNKAFVSIIGECADETSDTFVL